MSIARQFIGSALRAYATKASSKPPKTVIYTAPTITIIGERFIPKKILDYLEKQGASINADSAVYLHVKGHKVTKIDFYSDNSNTVFQMDEEGLSIKEYLKTLGSVSEDGHGVI